MTEEVLKICPKCKTRSVKFIEFAGTILETRRKEKNVSPTSYWYCVKCGGRYHLEKGKLVPIFAE